MKNRGFTIIELMIAVSIVAIVMAFGIPSFMSSIKNNRLTSQLNSFIGALNYARSEAVKLGQNNVTICASSDGATCSNTNEWELGWLVFRNTANDTTYDSADGDLLLRQGSQLSGGNTLRTVGFNPAGAVSYGSLGAVTTTGSFKLCDDRGPTTAKGIVINISGQARIATDDDATTDDIVNLHLGGNITCP